MAAAADDVVIQVMPEALANKIAAGEVVQRPASVAKELLENALDAGAGEVTLLLKEAGSTLVQVVDDGCGMSRRDAVACFERHATSKIRSVEDLECIQTLGFRGEALASIAAVAQVELKTRRVGDAAGTRVRIEGGTVAEAEPCAVPSGTSVAVRNLFYNVPARRNFLKTPATEFKHLAETFQFLALAHPEVAFTLVHNGNEVYRLPPARSGDFHEALARRIADLLGREHAGQLVPVEDASSYVAVRGFVGKPEFNRRTRGEQHLFVNGRHVESRYLGHAVRTAYGDLLPEGAFPFLALFLQLDPSRVDVNVHPTKAEVKFEDQSGIYGFLRSAVRSALGAGDLVPQFRMDRDEAFEEEDAFEEEVPTSFQPRRGGPMGEGDPAEDEAAGGTDGQAFKTRLGPRPPAARAEQPAEALGAQAHQLYRLAAQAEGADDEPASSARPAEAAPGERRRVLWQLQRRYVVTEDEEGLLIVDQQAAHRRVLYERARRSMQEAPGQGQRLLFPHTLEFSPADFELVRELMPKLRALGFEVEPFSGRTVVIRGVPPDVREGEERGVLESLIEQYKANRDALRSKQVENLARSLAARNALRPGQPLEPAAMQQLLDDLFRCEMPYADPQGRPTMIRLSVEELTRRFRR